MTNILLATISDNSLLLPCAHQITAAPTCVRPHRCAYYSTNGYYLRIKW